MEFLIDGFFLVHNPKKMNKNFGGRNFSNYELAKLATNDNTTIHLLRKTHKVKDIVLEVIGVAFLIGLVWLGIVVLGAAGY